MFTTPSTETPETLSGAALNMDFENFSKNDAMALGSVVVGAGVVGTSLLIAAYAAPAPIIGGAAIGVGLGIASSLVEETDDKIKKTKKSDKAKKSSSEVKTVTKQEAPEDQVPAVTNMKGVEIDIDTL